MNDQQMKSISVEDLLRSGNISRRTYNILVKARLRTLFDLRKYKNGLRRLFSPQSPCLAEVDELVARTAQVDHLPNITGKLFMDPVTEKLKGEQLLDSLGEREMQLLSLVYENKLKELFSSRQRGLTVIANALSQVPVNIFLRDFLYEDDDRIMILYNVGKTSVEHFVGVKQVMLREVELLMQQPEMLGYRIFVQLTKGTFDDDDFIRQFYEAHHRLPMLYVLQQFIINNKSRAEMRAFLNRYDIFEGRVELDSTPIDRSAYTIATYSNTIYDALFDPSAEWEAIDRCAQTVMDDEEARKGVADYPDDDFIGEDSQVVMQLAVDEHLLLSPTCIIAFLGKLLAQRYATLGGYPRSLLTAKADRWNHIYLVSHTLDNKYAFRTMFYVFRDEVYAKSVENSMVSPRDFIVQQYPGMEEEPDLTLATDILRQIVVGELALETDEEGSVNVPRKVERPLADRLYIILSNNGQSPISLKRLTEIINSDDGRKYVKATVSLALNKDPRFVNNGKKGLYALSEWQLPYFGSNVDIIYKVLSQYDRPMESDEILDVLNQYPYNESLGKNELSSVISISKDKFRKFGFGYYGLADREYDPELIRPVRNNFEVDLEAFRSFVETNHRLPSAKNNAEEKRLAYWFARKRKDYDTKSNWTESKRKAFKEIIDLYEQYLEVPEILPENQQIAETTAPPADADAKIASEALELSENSEFSESSENSESSEFSESSESSESSDSSLSQEDADAIAAVTPEIVAEPPIAMFAIEEESPFIAPDNPEEPPVEIFINETQEEPENSEFSESSESSEFSESSEGPSSPECPESPSSPSSQESPSSPSPDEWHLRLEEVREFVLHQHREPLALFTEEYQMACWLEEQKSKWHAALLSPSQEELLLAIRDMIW